MDRQSVKVPQVPQGTLGYLGYLLGKASLTGTLSGGRVLEALPPQGYLSAAGYLRVFSARSVRTNPVGLFCVDNPALALERVIEKAKGESDGD